MVGVVVGVVVGVDGGCRVRFGDSNIVLYSAPSVLRDFSGVTK